MEKGYADAILQTESISEIFQLVQEMVSESTGKKRENIAIEMRDLGFLRNGFVGAYYNLADNTITLNLSPLQAVFEQKREHFKWYLFHVLLYEYVHALGIVSEQKTRELTFQIIREYFKDTHVLARMAKNAYLPYAQQAPPRYVGFVFKEEDFKDFEFDITFEITIAMNL